jgi:hypothetical protein
MPGFVSFNSLFGGIVHLPRWFAHREGRDFATLPALLATRR